MQNTKSLYCDLEIMSFESNLPSFECSLAIKQRNIAFALFGIITVVAIICASYLEVNYEMTFEMWMIAIIGLLSGIVTAILVMINAYKIEKAFRFSKDGGEFKLIYENGRAYGNGLLVMSLIIVFTVTFYYFPVS